jgi:hypothetical protein
MDFTQFLTAHRNRAANQQELAQMPLSVRVGYHYVRQDVPKMVWWIEQMDAVELLRSSQPVPEITWQGPSGGIHSRVYLDRQWFITPASCEVHERASSGSVS